MSKKSIKYEEKSIYNENGELINFSTGSVSKSYNSSVDPAYYHSIPYTTPVTTTPFYVSGTDVATDFSKMYTPPPMTTMNNLEDYMLPTKEKDEKIKRKEIVDITRMNTIKEILDMFDKCNEFIDIYKFVDELKKEYKKLACIED